MKRNISNLSFRTFDLLIIGGGINGAAIANIASLNRLNVALIEKGDFASGTSGKSTKLLHGGLRYLENFEFGLVAESLRERSIQVKSAPHLVKILPFIIPVYRNDPRPLWKMRLGVWLYDVLSGKYSLGRHQTLSAAEVLEWIPGLKADNLKGGVLYYDAQMNDARLCLENVLMAQERGAAAANYVEMQSFLKDNGRCNGVKARDNISGRTFEIKAKHIVCAAGVWTDEIFKKDRPGATAQIRATKGAHILYRKRLSDAALFLQSASDGRIFFIIPWQDHSMIGTTDTDFSNSPDDVRPEKEDIDYLIVQAQRFFPNEPFRREDITGSFAGLRPLVKAQGSPSKVSRKHKIRVSESGVVYVMGGKYTTYRVIAEDALKKIIKHPLIDTSRHYPLYGGGDVHDDLNHVSREYGVGVDIVKQLIEIYGTRYREVLKSAAGVSVAKGQMIYAVEHEMAVTAEDILQRRLGLWEHQQEYRTVAESVIRKIENLSS